MIVLAFTTDAVGAAPKLPAMRLGDENVTEVALGCSEVMGEFFDDIGGRHGVFRGEAEEDTVLITASPGA